MALRLTEYFNLYPTLCLACTRNSVVMVTPSVFLQIVSFLQKHAHPQVAKKVPVVPETVVDQVCKVLCTFSCSWLSSCMSRCEAWPFLQIRLWEQDRNRVLLAPSYLYDDFRTQVRIICLWPGDVVLETVKFSLADVLL